MQVHGSFTGSPINRQQHPTSMPKPDQRLLESYARLNADNRDSLLSFAEFLLSRQDTEEQPAASDLPAEIPAAIADPVDIPRRADESVVAAIRRLRQTYPMIDRSAVFHESASLMTRHMVDGITTEATISELEALFSGAYDKLKTPEETP